MCIEILLVYSLIFKIINVKIEVIKSRGIYMISLSYITKKYKKFTALEEVSFSAKSGQITGFVGPNGAGKSTALRCIVGLTLASSGEATIFGNKYQELKNPFQSVGIVLDASKLHSGRTGRAILEIAATVIGVPKSRINEVLKECGLTIEEGEKRVKTYSLGMRQRLCIAQALLGKPKVLILDEPMNGLDPEGIRWIRSLLKEFAKNGGTVLLSSHLLSEMQKLADHIVMIGKGKILIDKPLSDLISDGNDLEDIYIELTKEFSRQGGLK